MPFGHGPVVWPEDKVPASTVHEKRQKDDEEYYENVDDDDPEKKRKEGLALKYCTHEDIQVRLMCAEHWIRPYYMSNEVAQEIAHKNYTGVVFD